MQPYPALSVSLSLFFLFPQQAQVEHERKALDLLTNLEVSLLFVVKKKTFFFSFVFPFLICFVFQHEH